MKYEKFKDAEMLDVRICNIKHKVEELEKAIRQPQYYSLCLIVEGKDRSRDIPIFSNDTDDMIAKVIPPYIEKLKKEVVELIAEFESL